MNLIWLLVGIAIGAIVGIAIYIVVYRIVLKGRKEQIIEKAELEAENIKKK